jgi:glycosyltransferase involved in cell wall biosynthesis
MGEWMRERSPRLPHPERVLVDVGVAACGRSPYLTTAIASVQRQVLRSWRLHISQDGPGEASLQQLVATRADDPRISWSATKQPVGAAANKTRLLRAGTAPYIALLDHDDVWDSGFLLRRVRFLDSHPSCAFVFSPLTVVDASGCVVERRPALVPEGAYASEEILPVLLGASGIAGGSVLIRRAALQEVGDHFCEFLPRTYDYEMWIRLALRSSVGHLDVRDVYWRRHAANASSRHLRDCDQEYRRLVSHLSELVATERPDVRLGRDVWRRKLAALLLMTSVDALTNGDRRIAGRYLWLAVWRARRAALTGGTLAVALKVGCGRCGVAAAAGLVRLNRLRRATAWGVRSARAR